MSEPEYCLPGLLTPRRTTLGLLLLGILATGAAPGAAQEVRPQD